MAYVKEVRMVGSEGLEASLGNIPGKTTVNKFGETINADSGVATDIWDGSTTQPIWLAPTAARVHTIVSTSNTDSDTGGVVAQGAGARTVRISYLPDWDTKETTVDVVLDGTTGVTMPAAVMIHRMKCLTWGANGVNAGVISATAASDATVTASILAGNNQTQMCIYGIPSTQKFRMTQAGASVVKNTGVTQRADGEILFMRDPETNVVAGTAWTNKENFLLVEGQNPWGHMYGEVPKKFDGPGIIKMQVTANAADVKVVALFDGILIDN